MEVAWFVASSRPSRGGRDGGSGCALAIFDPRPTQVWLEDIEQIVSVQEKAETTPIWAEGAGADGYPRWVQAPPIVDVIVALGEVRGGVIRALKFGGVGNGHLGAKAADARPLRSATVLGPIARGVHGAVSVHLLLVVGRFVIPRDSKLLAEIVVKVREGGVGVSLELEFDVAVVVNEHEGGLDVETTELDALPDLDEVRETDTTLIESSN